MTNQQPETPQGVPAPTRTDGHPQHVGGPTVSVGQRIGSYKIREVLGRGGMGVVYLAEQDKPRRTVALKVIRPGVATPDLLRRFAHEAEILGRLTHPGIAQIYEAGTADVGGGPQPYFAMELVKGVPLTQYAQGRELSSRARLELLAKVCDAVQHAHQKGVIHRDLKPGNVLVTEEGQPKILDFGVARATESDIQVTALQTDIGQLIGTIPYMSPEQAAGDPRELDMRSDVYALGVMAYELLAGRLPYDLRAKMILEAVRVIREDTPAPLSSVNRTFRGDVETIIGKALEKDRSRRYQSASDLAADLRRYLADEPIIARPPSAMYQLGKFAKRNKTLVGGVAATFIVLVAGLVGTSYGLRQAIAARDEQSRAREEAVRERQRAEGALAREEVQREVAEQREKETEQVAEFQASQLSGIDVELMGVRLRRTLLDEARAAMSEAKLEPQAIEAQTAELEKLLAGANFTNLALKSLDENIFERALNAVNEQFADQPVVRARLLQTVATTLCGLGLLDRATAPQTEALDIRRRLLGNDHPGTLTSIVEMGVLFQSQGKLAEAEPYFREAMAGYRRVLGDDHPDTLTSINNTALSLRAQGKLAEAEPYYREALAGFRRVLGGDHPDTLNSIGNMGELLRDQGKYAEAEPYCREALDGCRRVLGDDDPATLGSINNMGGLLEMQGRLAEAEPYYLEAAKGCRRVLGDDHPQTLNSINNLGALLQAQGKFAEAEPHYRQALEGRRRVLGGDHPDTLTSMNNLGMLFHVQGKLAEAEPYYREALAGYRRVLGDDHPLTLNSVSNLGALLNSQGKLAEAEAYYREALETRRRVLGDDHPGTLISINNMGTLLRDLGRHAEAEELGAEAVQRARTALPAGHWHIAGVLFQHGWTLALMGRFAEAEAELLEAHETFVAALGPEDGRTIGGVKALIDLYDAWHAADPGAGHDAQAAEWRVKLEQWRATTQPAATQPAPEVTTQPTGGGA